MSSVLSWRKRVNRICHEFNVLVYQTTRRPALLEQGLKAELCCFSWDGRRKTESCEIFWTWGKHNASRYVTWLRIVRCVVH